MSETLDERLVKASCDRCQKPVYAEDGYNGATMNHWQCEKRSADAVATAFADMDKALGAFGFKAKRHQRRAGEGRVSLALQKKLRPLLEEIAGVPVSDMVIWVQVVADRGPCRDLAGWGGFADFEDGKHLKVSFHSWVPMTELVKAKAIKLVREHGSMSYDVYPVTDDPSKEPVKLA